MADLIAIAAEVEQRDPTSKLPAALKNAGRAQSCVADVALARTTMEALAQLRGFARWAPSIHKTAAEHALLANAAILYARAAATGGKAGERGATIGEVEDWIGHSPEQLEETRAISRGLKKRGPTPSLKTEIPLSSNDGN